MASTLELDGLNELRAALIEERQIIVASVRKLRESCQPTTRRENTSITNAAYTQPENVRQ